MAANIRVEHGDCRDVIRTLADASIDSVVTDPPYSLGEVPHVNRSGSFGGRRDEERRAARRGFMGKRWDTGETAFDPAFWAEVLRALKPGGHAAVFGSSRTHHRLFCVIEDAGFEIRDTICWVFSQGFPKSKNVGNGFGTALKPAAEFICLARKPLGEKTVAANVLAHGTGALNIDGCRVESEEALGRLNHTTSKFIDSANGSRDAHPRTILVDNSGNKGRWPANLIHDGSAEVLAGFPDTGSSPPVGSMGGGSNNHAIYGDFAGRRNENGFGDCGSAARFFYTAKADAGDRLSSKHPTVKPVDLMAYLVRLITPPGGTVLDPFAGSGSTGMACMREGFDCIMIEREAEYVADIRYRLEHVDGSDTPLFTPPFMAPVQPVQPSLFDPYADGWPDAAANSKGCYDVAIEALREEFLKNSAE